jgi:hypothetical protein
MSFIQNFFSSRDNNANTQAYVGQTDRLWYNPDTNSIRVSDGSTPGGLPINLDTDANASFNSITANTGTINGNLVVTGNISPAAEGKIGGVQPGPGVTIGNTGILTIDSANLPVSFGNFYANNNILTIVNVDEDMILATQGNAIVKLVGNVQFVATDSTPGTGNIFMNVENNGYMTIFAPGEVANGALGLLSLNGSPTGNVIPIRGTGGMLHITGNPNTAARFTIDGFYNNTSGPQPSVSGYPTAGFGLNISRAARGTPDSPSYSHGGDTLGVYGAVGWVTGTTNRFNPLPVAGLYFKAAEDFNTSTATGTYAEMILAPTGSNAGVVAANITSSGITANTFTATANITGGNLVTGGALSVTGNANVGNLTATKLSGLLTRVVRDAGTISDGGTLTIDITSDDIVHCTWNNGMSLAYTNFAPGRVVKVLATKGSGSGTDTLNIGGVTASHTSSGSTTITGTADQTVILDLISTNSSISGLYIKV